MSVRHHFLCAFVVVALPCVVACGPGQVRETPPPVCVLQRPTPEGQQPGEPSNAELLRLVLGSRARIGQLSPSADCRGEVITAPRIACEERTTTLPAVLVGDEQVISRRVSATEQLVWIIARSDGIEGEGPIALVEKREQSLVVRAKGVLRADIARARPRLVLDGKVLLADAERCTGDNPASCERTAHLLVRRGVRFERLPVLDENDRCMNGPSFALNRTMSRDLPDGWRRRFELAASWQETGNAIVIHETVTMRDADPRTLAIPPRPFRVVSADRIVTVHDGFTADARPLLERALVEFGSVAAAGPGE